MQNTLPRVIKLAGANTLIPNCERLRTRAGKSIAALVDASSVSRDTVSKIEAGTPIKPDKAFAVFKALNEWHKGTLDEDKEVVQATSKRS